MICPRCNKSVDNNAICCSGCGMETPEAGCFYSLDAYNSWKVGKLDNGTANDVTRLSTEVCFPFVSDGSDVAILLSDNLSSEGANQDESDSLIKLMAQMIQSNPDVLEYRLVKLLCEAGYLFRVDSYGITVDRYLPGNNTFIFTSDDFRAMLKSTSSDLLTYLNLIERLDSIRSGKYEDEVEEEIEELVAEVAAEVSEETDVEEEIEPDVVEDEANMVQLSSEELELARQNDTWDGARRSKDRLGIKIVTFIAVISVVVFIVTHLSGEKEKGPGVITQDLMVAYAGYPRYEISVDDTFFTWGRTDASDSDDIAMYLKAGESLYSADDVVYIYKVWSDWGGVECVTFKSEDAAIENNNRNIQRRGWRNREDLAYDGDEGAIMGSVEKFSAAEGYDLTFYGEYGARAGWFWYANLAASFRIDNEIFFFWINDWTIPANPSLVNLVNKHCPINPISISWYSYYKDEAQKAGLVTN